MVSVQEDGLVRVFLQQLELWVAEHLHSRLIGILWQLYCFFDFLRTVLVFFIEEVQNGGLVAINDNCVALSGEASLHLYLAVKEGPSHLPVLILILVPLRELIHCCSHSLRKASCLVVHVWPSASLQH